MDPKLKDPEARPLVIHDAEPDDDGTDADAGADAEAARIRAEIAADPLLRQK